MSEVVRSRTRKISLIVIIARIVLATLLSGTVIYLHPDQLSLALSFVLGAYALSAVHFWLWKYGERPGLAFNVQFYSDLILVTTLLYVTGGVYSAFIPLYLLIIVYAGLIGHREGGILALVLSSISYTGVVNVGYLMLLPVDFSQDAYRALLLRIFATILGLVGVAALAISLSEKLHQIRQQLGITKDSLRALVNSIHSGLLTLDLKGDLIFLNQAAREILGRSEKELLQQPFSTIFPKSVLEQILQCDFQLNPRGLRTEFPVKNLDGRSLVIGMSCSPLLSEQGERTGYVISFQDLTKIKEQEEH